MSTLFKGLGDAYGSRSTPATSANSSMPLVFPAQVIEVCTSTASPLYETARDIGKMRFRDLVADRNTPEKDLTSVAYPLDRSFIRYPYPGEQVLIFVALSETGDATSTVIQPTFFYSFVLSTFHNVSYNQHPLLGVTVPALDPNNPFLAYDSAKIRFDKRAADINSVKDGANKIKIYKQLRPQEGDYIIQGRFGTSMRFSSTSPSAEGQTPWNSNNPTGVSGDGIIVLRADRDNTTEESSMLVNEDIDGDDSSVYICTSQKIEMVLACSKKLLSWKARYDLQDTGAAEAEGIVGTTKDTSQLWQKVIDTTKPVTTAYQTPPGT